MFFQNLLIIYADMHNNGTIWDDAKSTFDGKSLRDGFDNGFIAVY